MTTPKPFLMPRTLKGVPARREGQSTGTLMAEHTDRGGEKTVLGEETTVKRIATAGSDETAMVGSAIGVTIPGPPKSYMAVRVDAFVYLPCRPDEQSIRAAQHRAHSLADSHLEELAGEAQKFFNGG